MKNAKMEMWIDETRIGKKGALTIFLDSSFLASCTKMRRFTNGVELRLFVS